jgi:hypothetical protein
LAATDDRYTWTCCFLFEKGENTHGYEVVFRSQLIGDSLRAMVARRPAT